MGNCDCSMVAKTGRMFLNTVIPFVYFFLMALGCIYTFTLRENASVKTSWIYIMTFTFVFILIAVVMLVVAMVNMCREGTSSDTELFKSLMRETCWWLGLVTSSCFVMGLVWWVNHENYTDDTWQHEVAMYTWAYAVVGTMVTPFIGYSIYYSMPTK